jgi:hypothetical protein
MAGIASAATAVVIGHVAADGPCWVGAGGIMLPNHAPVIWNSLNVYALRRPHDLGLGAPGTDMRRLPLCAAIWREDSF